MCLPLSRLLDRASQADHDSVERGPLSWSRSSNSIVNDGWRSGIHNLPSDSPERHQDGMFHCKYEGRDDIQLYGVQVLSRAAGPPQSDSHFRLNRRPLLLVGQKPPGQRYTDTLWAP